MSDQLSKAWRAISALVVLFALLSPAALAVDTQSGQGQQMCAFALTLQEAPVANASVDGVTLVEGRFVITVGDKVVFNASASVPSAGGTITNYSWNFTYLNTKYVMYGVAPNFTFNSTVPGGLIVCVTLNVTDSNGLWDTDVIQVLIRERPQTFLEKYFWTIFIWTIIGLVVLVLAKKRIERLIRGDPLVTEADREKFRMSVAKTRKILRQLMRNPMGVVGVVILAFFSFLAIFGPILAPYDVKVQVPEEQLQLPSKDHWLGTDNFGIDIFSELLYGARTSIIVGMVSAVIASFLGAAVGLYSGYVGGWKDEVVMRLNDIVLSIPWLVLMIVVAAFMGSIDLTGIILIIGLTGWSTTARMVRAQVLSVKERQYIERARALGSTDMQIITRHVFPNTFPLVFANTILTVAVSILSEATLSFLGMRPVGEVTWGTMLSFAEEKGAFQYGLHWWILAPGLCIVVVVLGFTLLGYALDEILNPKLRHR